MQQLKVFLIAVVRQPFALIASLLLLIVVIAMLSFKQELKSLMLIGNHENTHNTVKKTARLFMQSEHHLCQMLDELRLIPEHKRYAQRAFWGEFHNGRGRYKAYFSAQGECVRDGVANMRDDTQNVHLLAFGLIQVRSIILNARGLQYRVVDLDRDHKDLKSLLIRQGITAVVVFPILNEKNAVIGMYGLDILTDEPDQKVVQQVFEKVRTYQCRFNRLIGEQQGCLLPG